ncbi:hypothetical protein BJ546DRAFT_525672 [Cryomyces antarcticus]
MQYGNVLFGHTLSRISQLISWHHVRTRLPSARKFSCLEIEISKSYEVWLQKSASTTDQRSWQSKYLYQNPAIGVAYDMFNKLTQRLLLAIAQNIQMELLHRGICEPRRIASSETDRLPRPLVCSRRSGSGGVSRYACTQTSVDRICTQESSAEKEHQTSHQSIVEDEVVEVTQSQLVISFLHFQFRAWWMSLFPTDRLLSNARFSLTSKNRATHWVHVSEASRVISTARRSVSGFTGSLPLPMLISTSHAEPHRLASVVGQRHVVLGSPSNDVMFMWMQGEYLKDLKRRVSVFACENGEWYVYQGY